MMFSDLRYDFVRTWFTKLDKVDFGEFEALFRALEQEGNDLIAASSVRPDAIKISRALDMRYVGQEHVVTVDIPMELFGRQDRGAIKALFDTVHEQRYGTSAPAERAEVASLRTTVTGVVRKPPLEEIAKGDATPPKAADTGVRQAYFNGAGGFVATPTFARAALLAGNCIAGPALIEEHASTTVALPGDSVEVDRFGNLVITIGASRQ
jgi:N-methylhydantoinase A